MVKITIAYPNKGGRFDTDYYLNVHMPLSIEKQGSALKRVEVETGISSGQDGSAPPFCGFVPSGL
jgi:uncharacterized protein (TIGR02118 family)